MCPRPLSPCMCHCADDLNATTGAPPGIEHVGFRVAARGTHRLGAPVCHQIRCASKAERDEWLMEVPVAASAVPAVAETRRLFDVATEQETTVAVNAGAELGTLGQGRNSRAKSQRQRRRRTQKKGQRRREKARPQQQRQGQPHRQVCAHLRIDWMRLDPTMTRAGPAKSGADLKDGEDKKSGERNGPLPTKAPTAYPPSRCAAALG